MYASPRSKRAAAQHSQFIQVIALTGALLAEEQGETSPTQGRSLNRQSYKSTSALILDLK